MLTMAFMMRRATLRPNPRCVRQILPTESSRSGTATVSSWHAPEDMPLLRSKQGYIATLLPPFTQFSCPNISVGCESINITVKLLKIHHWTYLWFILLHFSHQKDRPFGGSQFLLFVWHKPAIAHPCVELPLVVLLDLCHYWIFCHPVV